LVVRYVVQEAHSWKLVEGYLGVENMPVSHLMGTPESKGVVAQFLHQLRYLEYQLVVMRGAAQHLVKWGIEIDTAQGRHIVDVQGIDFDMVLMQVAVLDQAVGIAQLVHQIVKRVLMLVVDWDLVFAGTAGHNYKPVLIVHLGLVHMTLGWKQGFEGWCQELIEQILGLE